DTPCDEGNACTTRETCQQGACLGSLLADGTACDDGNACTTLDTCVQGTCVGATVADGTACDDANACTDSDVCVRGTCRGSTVADGTSCSDGNACTQTDTCQAGACVGGDPVTCSAADPCHTAGVCDPATGVCSNPAAPDGAGCNDGNGCTVNDTCAGGACTSGPPIVCVALDACHDVGVCDPAVGACSNPPRDCTPPTVVITAPA